jgi:GNAT superfamily N-acetyltransferase
MATTQDRPSRWAVTHAAWKEAYREIYRPEEIDGVFDGSLPQHASWTGRRRADLGHIVAESGERIVGHVGTALVHTPARAPVSGEVTALYLLPDWQGFGLGRLLWEQALKRLQEYDCVQAMVWTINRAPAFGFYQHVGALQAEQGWYDVGDHREEATCFVLPLP